MDCDTAIVRIETFSTEHICLVRVTSRGGASGWGMTAPFDADIVAQILHRRVARFALGRAESEWETLFTRCLAGNYKFSGSHLARAIAGVDTALWDLRGRLAAKPVWQLISGPSATPLKAYASSMRRDNDPSKELDRLENACQKYGFRGVKVKIGTRYGDASAASVGSHPDRTAAIVKQAGLRFSRVGIVCMADANGAYATSRAAIQAGECLEDAGFGMFEEPCPCWDLAGTEAVTRSLSIPVSGGEQEWDPRGWDRLVHQRAVKIVQPDVCYAGGFTRSLAAARSAAEAGLLCLPHSSNKSLTLIFAAHLVRCIPNSAGWTEVSLERNEWCERVYHPVPYVENGHIFISQAPGWGVEPDQQWLGGASYAVSDIEDIHTP